MWPGSELWLCYIIILYALWLYEMALWLWNLLSSGELLVCMLIYTHLVGIYLFIYVLYVLIWLFINLFIPVSYLMVRHLWHIWRSSIHWCMVLSMGGVVIGGRMKGYFGGVGGGVGQWKKSSCDTNSNCCSPCIGQWYNLRPLYV